MSETREKRIDDCGRELMRSHKFKAKKAGNYFGFRKDNFF